MTGNGLREGMSLAQSRTRRQCLKQSVTLRLVLHLLHAPCKGSTPAPGRPRTSSFLQDPNQLLGPAGLRPHPLRPRLLLTARQRECDGEMAEVVEIRFGRRAHGPKAGVQGATCAPAAVSVLSSVPDGACSGPARSPVGCGRAQVSWTCLSLQQTVSGAFAEDQGAGQHTISWAIRGYYSYLIPGSAPRPPTKW